MAEREANNQNLAAGAFAVLAMICVVTFLTYRGADVGRLPQLIGNLGGGPLVGLEGLRDSVVGVLLAILIGTSWFGVGSLALSYIRPAERERQSMVLVAVMQTAVGAAIWSILWFFLGLIGAYGQVVAGIAVVLGVTMALYRFRQILRDSRKTRGPEPRIGFDYLLLAMIVVPVVLALVASIAPPTAKDTLLYHFAVPKMFVSQGSNAFIEGNIASYLALGTEMHVVWARLLGGLVSPRVAETASGASIFLFFPLLVAALYGWAIELGISRSWGLMATAMVAAVPTAFHVASSGYIDIALALFVTLAIYALSRWWAVGSSAWIVLVAVFFGAALSIKLTALFVIAAFILIVLLRARDAENAGKVAIAGFAAVLLAGAIASPWYLRTWMATGSPVFPFYMSMWKGEAAGWDVERSNFFQGMNSQYGGTDANKLNYITAPVRVSVAAQPEQPASYDGVLGPAFLIGLPILIWALWKFDLPVEAKIGAGVAGVMYLFWLFSSSQLRYLLPILPIIAIAIAAAAEAISSNRSILNRVWKYSLTAAATGCVLTTAAWFFQKAPLRVALGGEPRDAYLARNLDYYSYYQALNSDTPPDAKVWLINIRRDTYHIERPIFSDYLFEDWTLRKLVWESRSVQELKAKTAAMDVKYVLGRHDFLFDYDRSTLVDDQKPRSENEAKLRIAREFILDPANTIKADSKFSLIKTYSNGSIDGRNAN